MYWRQSTPDHYQVAIVLTEEDIQNDTNFLGAGWELMILPKKYEDISLQTENLKFGISYCLTRGGRIIYL